MKKGIRQLDGKVAVITGAASGIGRALSIQLRDLGCHLALVDQDEAGLKGLEEQLGQADHQRNITVHVADVADKARMEDLASEVAAAHDGIHLLINNAGVGYEAAFQQTSLETWERVMGINLWGVIYGCHFFMPHLAKEERAHIVNMSSLFGIVGMAGQSVYCATKYAVRGLSEALWEELRATSIGLTVVHPGSVATNIMKTSEGDDPELMQRLADWYEQNALPPEKAAARIITAVQSGNPRLLITAEAVFADKLKRLMPVAGNKMMCDLAIRGLGLEDMREKREQQWQVTMVDGQPWD
jgi:short-subunit dehydrogenase